MPESPSAGTLERRIAQILTQRGLTLAVSESATGGRVADHLTDIPGSSAFFLGGVIAYDNTVKVKLLHVPETVLQQHGAVSPETAAAMAQGVLRLMSADLGLATTGIAGPSGATPQKPVGLVYVAVAGDRRTQTRRHVFSGPREENKQNFVRAALELLLEELET